MSWQPPSKPHSTQQTYYQLLQVDPKAHPTIIRYAYRYLASIYHPDNVESGNSEAFRILSDAFRILTDSGKRAAYDAQLGLKPAGPADNLGEKTQPKIPPKTSISWNEVELRLAVLQVLLEARRKRVQTGGASAKILMDCLHIDMSEMEFVLWYLREKGYITRTEASFMITVQGVDYLVDQLSKTQVLDEPNRSAPIAINLPAQLS